MKHLQNISSRNVKKKSVDHDQNSKILRGGKISITTPVTSKKICDGVGISPEHVQWIRSQHEEAIKEEQRQNFCLCVVVVVCVLVAIGLLAVALVDNFNTPTGQLMMERMPDFSDKTIKGKIGTKPSRPLVNLTESCMKLYPTGCFYHKNIYPDNCNRTKCNSIMMDLGLLKNHKC
uniref:Uncharacterized protein n=1 Tax=Romanomermis culicivorax TaxID=13658 RepID=A0A915HLQ3_ROMCU